MNGDDRLEAEVRARLETDLDRDDELLNARLRAIRLKALERARRGPVRATDRFVPAATVAAALLLAITFSLQRAERTPDEPALFDLLADSQDLELIEDLEFYEWLDRDEHAG